MNIRKTIRALALLAFALMLMFCLYAETPLFLFNTIVGPILQQILAAVRSAQTQWLISSAACFYSVMLMSLQLKADNELAWWSRASTLCLAVTFLVAGFSYFYSYPFSAESTQLLTLFSGFILGRGTALFATAFGGNAKSELDDRADETAERLRLFIATLLVLFIAAASIWRANAGRSFGYHERTRLSGPWDNPNLFGLMMGTGLTLAAGLGFSLSRPGRYEAKSVFGGRCRFVRKFLFVGFGFFAIWLFIHGLFGSYSRGAWVGTFCGCGYLAWVKIHLPRAGCQSGGDCWLHRNGLSVFILLAFIVVLVFLDFGRTEWHSTQRIFSAVSSVDFSWRNRVAAWEGSLQIIGEEVWLGAGWNRPEQLYEYYYLPPRLTDGAAIEVNDYLMLGSTLGLSALFCFGMYLWLSLTNQSERRVGGQRFPDADRLQSASVAGTIVLVVGFWFDGGLFNLATASTFWILLEMGNVRRRAPKEIRNHG
jgi:hypothetical protein